MGYETFHSYMYTSQREYLKRKLEPHFVIKTSEVETFGEYFRLSVTFYLIHHGFHRASPPRHSA